MRQNICNGYFALDQTQIVEVVTWQTQYRETQHWDLELWLSLYFMQCRQSH